MPAPENENEAPHIIDLQRRSTDEVIAHHLGTIAYFLSSIASDLRYFRKEHEVDHDGD